MYTIYIETGSMMKAGTDSQISITLGDSSGRSVWIPNLKAWGLMPANHDYFERGNVDIFAGRGPCIGAPICRLNVTSDGSGAHHGWLCHSVEVTSTGHHKACARSNFYVDQWLATDVAPYQLSALLDGCGDFKSPKRRAPFSVRNTALGSTSSSK